MATIFHIPLTLFGDPVTGVRIPIGSTVNWDLILEYPDTRLPISLAGVAVQMTFCSLDVFGNPAQPEIFSHAATVVDAAAGKCLVAWAPTDTANLGAVLSPGFYGVDVWTTDLLGNRLQNLGFVDVELLAVATLPSTLVTPVPGQPPLGTLPLGTNGYLALNLSGSPLALVGGATIVPVSAMVPPYLWTDVSADIALIEAADGYAALNAQVSGLSGFLLLARVGPKRLDEIDGLSVVLVLNGELDMVPLATTLQDGLLEKVDALAVKRWTASIVDKKLFVDSDLEVVTIPSQGGTDYHVQLTLQDSDALTTIGYNILSATSFEIVTGAPVTATVRWALLK